MSTQNKRTKTKQRRQPLRSSAVVRHSRRCKRCHATLSTLGVEIIDRDGSHLVGITDEDALNLLGSLAKLMPRVLRRLPTSDDILF